MPTVWMLVALGASLAKLRPDRHNNFTIFRSSWLHLSELRPLYTLYPEEYVDLYLYGPTFAVFMAPLALLPEPLAYLVWQLSLAALFLWSLALLPIRQELRLIVMAYSLHELVTALMMQQWNIGIGALIILTYVLVERKGSEHWAALCIAIGLTTKIYGIVGLAFFPFVQHKLRFALSLIGWTLLLLALPMFVAGVEYTHGQYIAWIEALSSKGSGNLFSLMQNISLLGILRKVSGLSTYSDLLPIGIGLAVYGAPFLRFGQYNSRTFRLMILATTLLFVVLFSTGSESSSYIILFPAVALWYVARPIGQRHWTDTALLIGTFVLSSLSPTDIFPRYLRETWVVPYALKALFPSLVWLRVSYELLTRDFKQLDRHLGS